MANNTNGLIYFKLDTSKIYNGDITKNCGLLGEEIDSNFYFLRGYDIKDVSFDENKNLVVTRLNGEQLIAEAIPEEVKPDYGFSYNTETGVLTIITPDGKEIIVDGFITEKFITDYCTTYIDERVDRNVYHDYTLEGTGIKELPLKVTNITKTGRYRPAIKLIDTTKGEKLPNQKTDKIAKNERYVTKEVVSRFGALYPLEGVFKIQETLDKLKSGWRIPTKQDWDKLLNTIDCAKPNHNEETSNVVLGEDAGAILKSTKLWKKWEGELLSEDSYGFSIYPVGYAGNRGRKFYGSFGELTAFWTSTEEDNHQDMFVKIFDYSETGVKQNTWGGDCHLSLRLVKDYNPQFGYNETEVIDGVTVNCIHIEGQNLIWTKENVAFSKEEYHGFVPSEWEQYYNQEENFSDVRYFINDWNGKSWDKNEIREGEGIVLYEGDNGRMHEWILVDGVLIDSAVLLKTEFQKEIDNINKKLENEQQERIAADNAIEEKLYNVDLALTDKIQQEADARKQTDEEIIEKLKNINNDLNQKIIQETEDRLTSDEKIIAEIELERSQRENADNELKNTIDKLNQEIEKEIIARQEVDKELTNSINIETQNRQDEDKKLDEKINNEIQERIDSDTELKNEITRVNDNLNQEIKDRELAIDLERSQRENVDNEINDKLNKEIVDRQTIDDELQKQITQNKVHSNGNTIIITPNNNGNGTDISVNIDKGSNIKIDDKGCIYFDGNFGTF